MIATCPRLRQVLKLDESFMHGCPGEVCDAPLPCYRLLLFSELLSVYQPLVRKSMLCRDLVDAAKKYHLRPDLRPLMQSDSTRVRTGELKCLTLYSICYCKIHHV